MPNKGPVDTPLLELEERRKRREPIILVWDIAVRLGHWTMVLFFAVIYLRYQKFPIHAYAGYIVLILVVFRLVWGVIGSRAARFSSFFFSPQEVLDYARSAAQGHAGYYVSHNPMGSWMVFALLFMMLINGSVGIMLYSSGQQLGPLGFLVSEDWEDMLKVTHRVLGHLTAAAVAIHITGVLWAARLHRENYVLAMFTGHKRVPRKVDASTIAAYPVYRDEQINPALRPIEQWLNRTHPFFGSLLIIFGVALVVTEVMEALIYLNQFLLAY